MKPVTFLSRVLATAGCLALASTVAGGQRVVIVPPLHTDGHHIVDFAGNAIRLASVNWYGFDEKEYVAGGLDHQPLARIVALIQQIGVNSVRIPWANETLERNPFVQDYALAANPQLKGKRAMDVLDAVISALTNAHIMVILDNHVSRADWCCSETDGNGLWYGADYPEEKWLHDWAVLATRYRDNQWVVGADLRNELRNGATWGGSDPKHDWHAAAERGGAAVLRANPNLLIMVEGPNYSTDFTGFDKLPVKLPVAHRLVYSPHAYSTSYGEHNEHYESRAGFLARMEPAVPVWFGEMGTCQNLDCGGNSEWFKLFVSRVLEKDDLLGWSWWALNGTQSSGVTRKFNDPETYGLLSPDYGSITATEIVGMLRRVEQKPER
jgi:endoglucanase